MKDLKQIKEFNEKIDKENHNLHMKKEIDKALSNLFSNTKYRSVDIKTIRDYVEIMKTGDVGAGLVNFIVNTDNKIEKKHDDLLNELSKLLNMMLEKIDEDHELIEMIKRDHHEEDEFSKSTKSKLWKLLTIGNIKFFIVSTIIIMGLAVMLIDHEGDNEFLGKVLALLSNFFI